MGAAYPDLERNRDFVTRRDRPRGGAVPRRRCATAWRSSTRRSIGSPSRGAQRRRSRSSCTTRSASRSSSRARSRRSAASRSTSTASTSRWHEQRRRGKDARKAGGQTDERGGRLPRAARPARADRVHRVRRRSSRRAACSRVVRAARRRRRRRDRPRPHARSTRSRAARSATPASITHRHGRAPRCSTRRYALPGLRRAHRRVVEGEIDPGRKRSRRSTASAATRSAATTPPRTSCTGRCARCSARTCKQAGSLVAPDRLRFDFSHYEPVTPEQLDADRGPREPRDHRRRAGPPLRDHEGRGRALGAIAFFGDKYGDIVRVLEAGPHSIELCGGTHVHALGFIGPIKIVSEGSIGSNLRRIEAITGTAPIERLRHDEARARRGRRACSASSPTSSSRASPAGSTR